MNDKHHLWLVHLFFFFFFTSLTYSKPHAKCLWNVSYYIYTVTRWRLSNSLRASKYTFLSELFRKIWRSIGQLLQLKHMDNFFTMGKVACGFLWTVGRRIGKVSSQEIEFPPSVWKLPDTGLSTEVTTHCAMPGHLKHLTDTYLLKEYFLNCEQVLISVFPFINLKMLFIADNLSSL